jgi:hypothetical protein
VINWKRLWRVGHMTRTKEDVRKFCRWENLEEIVYLGVLDIDGKRILNETEIAWESGDWIHLVQDVDKERPFVNLGKFFAGWQSIRIWRWSEMHGVCVL